MDDLSFVNTQSVFIGNIEYGSVYCGFFPGGSPDLEVVRPCNGMELFGLAFQAGQTDVDSGPHGRANVGGA